MYLKPKIMNECPEIEGDRRRTQRLRDRRGCGDRLSQEAGANLGRIAVVSDNIALILLLVPAYGFFWLHAFDPNLKTFVYVEGAKDDAPEMTFDATPSVLQPVALGWTIVLGIVVKCNEGNCNLHPADWNSVAMLLAVMTVAVGGKIVFGPTSGSFKSVYLSQATGPTRPFRLRALDYLRAYPVNFIRTLSMKLVLFAIFWAILWALGGLGLSENATTLVMPLYVVLAWTLTSLGRIATVLVSAEGIQRQVEAVLDDKGELMRRLPGGRQLVDNMLRRIRWTSGQKLFFLASMLLGLFCTYVLLEAALRFCGATPNGGLPAMRTVFSGLALIPILEGALVLVFGVIVGSVLHRHT
jgi:hypothetical protein